MNNFPPKNGLSSYVNAGWDRIKPAISTLKRKDNTNAVIILNIHQLHVDESVVPLSVSSKSIVLLHLKTPKPEDIEGLPSTCPQIISYIFELHQGTV